MRSAAALLLFAATSAFAQAPPANPVPPPDPEGIAQHDLNRTPPTVITPVAGVPPAVPGAAPSDATVLFDGKDLAAWKSQGKDAPAAWKVENGYMEVVKGTGAIETRQSFGDVQLHIEWMAPSPAVGQSQDRGNSGVFFGGGRYEVQVLDSYESKTYPDGQAGALYGQFPAARQRVPAAGRVAGLRHRVRDAALRRRGRRSRGARAPRCSRTACWCRTRAS